jgi:hypothetical protein
VIEKLKGRKNCCGFTKNASPFHSNAKAWPEKEKEGHNDKIATETHQLRNMTNA